jgi:hypothetical protein
MPATVSAFVGALMEVVVATVVALGIYLVAKQYHKRRWLQRHGRRTQGVVVRLEADTGDFEAAYYPVIRFHPVGFAPLEARYDMGNNPPGYAIGETVTLLYDPAHATRFVVGDKSGQGGACLLAMGIVGGIFAYCWHYSALF